MRLALAALGLAVIATGGAARSEPPYLSPSQVPDGLQILPAPPQPGSAADQADRTIFRQTRKLEGSARWRIATDDVNNGALDRYACALDMVLATKTAPVLAHLLDKIGTGDVVDPVKDYYHAPRPYLRDAGRICQPRTAHLDSNGNYPSGHAANGWLEALVLAEVDPTRATQILERGRQYGESRLVCGVHSKGAVEAGWMAGTAVFAALNGGSPTFRNDLSAAQHELATVATRAPKPNPARCASESAALADNPW